MWLPIEILREILQHAIEVIPISDLLRARLVNNFFAEEIMVSLLKNPRLETEGFGFGLYRPRNKHWWTRFPYRYKCQYLRHKIQEHPTRPCGFSFFIQQMLDVPNQRTTPDETEMLINQLIHAWLWGKSWDAWSILDSSRYGTWRERFCYTKNNPASFIPWGAHETFEMTLQTCLAVCAIKSGDSAGLQALFDRGLRTQGSRRFRLCPMDIAAQEGSEDINRVLVANNCPNDYEVSWYQRTNALSTAARTGNIQAMKVWTEPLTSEANSLEYYLRPALGSAARGGQLDVVRFIEKECNFKPQNPQLLFYLLTQAITTGQANIVAYFLSCGGFDVNMDIEKCRKGALFTALHDCPIQKRLPIMELLLENGADPNRYYLSEPRNAVQAAIKKGDLPAVKLLVRHGADIHAGPAPGYHRTKPILVLAIEQGSAPLVRLLLENGVDRCYMRRGRRYEVREDWQTGYRLRKTLPNSRHDARETIRKVEYFVVVHR